MHDNSLEIVSRAKARECHGYPKLEGEFWRKISAARRRNFPPKFAHFSKREPCHSPAKAGETIYSPDIKY